MTFHDNLPHENLKPTLISATPNSKPTPINLTLNFLTLPLITFCDDLISNELIRHIFSTVPHRDLKNDEEFERFSNVDENFNEEDGEVEEK